jgi:hypothetical protein
MGCLCEVEPAPILSSIGLSGTYEITIKPSMRRDNLAFVVWLGSNKHELTPGERGIIRKEHEPGYLRLVEVHNGKPVGEAVVPLPLLRPNGIFETHLKNKLEPFNELISLTCHKMNVGPIGQRRAL